jgi:hypothetical protein
MATGRFLAAVATVAAVAGALFASASATSAPLHGTGMSTLTFSTILSIREADGNTLIEQLNTRRMSALSPAP